tara:strand:+ start:777 stop:1073 length:297 start_codon:yes stop_codon:yes gene_type:complete
MERKVVVGIVIIIIIILLGFAIYSFTGAYITNAPLSCADSDNGRNFDIKGQVTNQEGKVFEDNCVEKTIVKEYYCDSNAVRSTRYGCPGDCVDGICVE